MPQLRVKHILVPVDFSLTSRHALLHAERIGLMTHARITLLHIIEPFLDSMGMDVGTVTAAARILDEMQGRGTERLQEMAETSSDRTGSKVHAVTGIGGIAQAIGRKARELRCDLIVMGTHGTGGFVRDMIGSNAYRVATVSRVPLLSVHRPLRVAGYRHIVYPVRETIRATDKFAHVLLFARMFNATVHLVGVPQPRKSASEAKVRELCVSLLKRFKRNEIETDMRVIQETPPAEAVIALMHSRPGALVVINQDHDIHLVDLFRRTFPKKIIHNVTSPVLTIPKR
jgi:nucleotide-binding universal stress UspA family protein